MYGLSNMFYAFLNEAQFVSELLGIGVTQLRKANYATKGIYFQSFTCLSTGIERICKLCLILDFYANNEGNFPDEGYIRRHGHQITNLFKLCQAISQQNNIQHNFAQNIETIHWEIIQILSDFADSSGRYANINTLLGRNFNKDCMNRWQSSVDLALYEKHISQGRKDAINHRAQVIGGAMSSFALVSHVSEDGTELSDPVEASRRTGIWEAVASYRQLYMLQIIRYLVELLMELGYIAMRTKAEDIPHFGEIFALFYNDDAYFRSRKTWDRI